MQTLISPIAIDLGAVNTGIAMTHHWEDSTEIAPVIGETIIVNPGKITLGMKTRTIKRHTERNYKRRKMAKRLLWVILRDVYSIDHILPQEESAKKRVIEAINGLLNRRGFTFLSEEEVTVGAKPREVYLVEIAKDIKDMWDTLLSVLTDTSLTPISFARLVGHISNLQLKCLRKYFNDKSFFEGDKWDAERMLHVYRRYLRSWHVENPSEVIKHTNRLALLQLCDSGTSVLDIWTSTDAAMSIPPYEDQNNRHPPKCRSLLLDPLALSTQYPSWKNWVETLYEYECGRSNNFFKNYSFSLNSDEAYARCLQVLFDRTTKTDAISLRKICQSVTPTELDDYQTLRQRLGNETDSFCACAKVYFKECDDVIKGVWIAKNAANLLRLCNANPPHKDKIAPELISTLLGFSFDEMSKEKLVHFLEETKLKHQKTLIGLAKDCATAQKTYGISFNDVYNEVNESHAKSKDKDEKLLWSIKTYLTEAAPRLVQYLFPKDAENIAKIRSFHSPYIWAQLYNILEGDAHGFSHSCRACTLDNRFRSATFKTEANGMAIANAKRLPGDSTQPFDGMVARLMKHIAVEAAKKKADHIKAWVTANQETLTKTPLEISIPVAIEENRFDFTEELSKLKKQDGYNSNVKQKSDTTAHKWEDKETRIKNDGGAICPYCGKPIVANGHIDHIIPRAYSLEKYETIFNSEANLIYSHAACNVTKGRNLYTFSDLNPNYLKAVFATSDIGAIEHKLLNDYYTLKKKKQNIVSAFVSLTREERNTIRHLLFVENSGSEISKVREALIHDLRHLNKTFVNGTQRWMVRYFRTALERNLQENNIPIKPIIYPMLFSAEDIHSARLLINQEKKHPQPVFSHVIDAALVLGRCIARQRAFLDAPFKSVEEERAFYTCLIPEVFSVNTVTRTEPYNRQPQSSPIFKDSIYGTKYLSVVVDKQGVLKAGFSSKNAVALTSKQKDMPAIYTALKQFLRQDKKALPETFDEIVRRVQQTKVAFICPIDAPKANEFLHQIAHDVTTDKLKNDQADWLDKLRYFSQKVDVIGTIADKDKGCLPTLQKAKKKQCLEQLGYDVDKEKIKPTQYDEYLAKLSHAEWSRAVDEIRNELSLVLKTKLTIPFNKGKIIHPALHDWENIVMSIPQHLLWQNVAEVAAEWTTIKQGLLKTKKSPKVRAHGKTATVFSLPQICDVSGGFRIRRKTSTGKTVWQTLSIAEFAIGGFSAENHELNTKKSILQPHLRQKNVSAIKGRAVNIQNTVHLDEWREIPLDIIGPNAKTLIKSLRIAPGSESRRNIRIALRSNIAEEIFGVASKQFSELEHDVKQRYNKGRWETYPELALVKPRDKKPIYLLAFGKDYLVIAYTSEQNVQQTNLYNQGVPLHLKQ